VGKHTRNSDLDLRSHVEFEEKIYGNPSFWEMKGMVTARNWLVQAGIGRPYIVLLGRITIKKGTGIHQDVAYTLTSLES